MLKLVNDIAIFIIKVTVNPRVKSQWQWGITKKVICNMVIMNLINFDTMFFVISQWGLG